MSSSNLIRFVKESYAKLLADKSLTSKDKVLSAIESMVNSIVEEIEKDSEVLEDNRDDDQPNNNQVTEQNSSESSNEPLDLASLTTLVKSMGAKLDNLCSHVYKKKAKPPKTNQANPNQRQMNNQRVIQGNGSSNVQVRRKTNGQDQSGQNQQQFTNSRKNKRQGQGNFPNQQGNRQSSQDNPYQSQWQPMTQFSPNMQFAQFPIPVPQVSQWPSTFQQHYIPQVNPMGFLNARNQFQSVF